jgi:hypothetical protein
MVSQVVAVEALRAEALAGTKEIATLDPIMTAHQRHPGCDAVLLPLCFSFETHELAHRIQYWTMATGLPPAEHPRPHVQDERRDRRPRRKNGLFTAGGGFCH